MYSYENEQNIIENNRNNNSQIFQHDTKRRKKGKPSGKMTEKYAKNKKRKYYDYKNNKYNILTTYH